MTDTVAAKRPSSGDKSNGASAAELLKQAVSGLVEAPAEAVAKAPAMTPNPGEPATKAAPRRVSLLRGAVSSRIDARTAALAAALTLGTAIGAGGTALLLAPRDAGSEGTLVALKTEIESGRAAMAQMAGEIGRLAGSVAKAGERSVEEAKGVRADLTQRLTRMEQTLAAKVASVADKHEAGDREQSARIASLAALIEKRAVPQPVAASQPVTPQAAKSMAVEPIQTGSLAEPKAGDTKAKPSAVSNWAVRDVYDGIAVLEDRKRRLVEVARGDIIPGIGRAEAIERRGRNWVVVTKDGLITPQDW